MRAFLFKGLVIAAAARPGEFATGNPFRGGTFTDSLLKTLKRKGKSRGITWSTIFHSTNKITMSLENQHLIYELKNN